MKHFLITPILALLLVSCSSLLNPNGKVEDGPYTDYYPNGSMKQSGLVTRGKMQGKWKFYTDDGNILAEGFYRNGVLNPSDTLDPPNDGRIGKWTFYYPNGNIRKAGTLEGDYMQGLWHFYTKEGVLDGQGRYIDGNGTNVGRTGVPIHGRDGEWKFFNPEGELRAYYEYSMGQLHGQSKTYYDSGNIRDVRFFVSGEQDSVALAHYDSGEPWFKAFFKEGKRHGPHEEWYENGQTMTTANYLGGKPQGKIEGWYENGQRKFIRNFEQGQEAGISQAWYENGNLREERNFVDGDIDGTCKTWFENGQEKYNVEYARGEISGKLVFWDENGEEATEELVKVATTMGTFVVDVFEEDAPVHAKNFKVLASTGALDSIYFHRIIPDFVVQGGDPLTRNNNDRGDDGTGGIGDNLPAEIGRLHLRGTLGAARDNNPEKSSSGSQFYVCLQDLPNLDNEYTVFGEVILGMEAVDRMALVETDDANNPLEPVYILGTEVGSKF